MLGADGAVDLRSMDENLQRQMARDDPGNDSSSDATVHLICRLGKNRIENIYPKMYDVIWCYDGYIVKVAMNPP